MTAGVQDGASKAVDLSGADVTGTLAGARAPAFTGDVTNTAGSLATTVGKINGTSLAGLATGILKNTTATGVPSIATAGTDYVIPSGSILGNAATVTTNANLTGCVTSVGNATSSTITSPVITTGMTASGSASNNFSGSSGAFQTSTGANTLNARRRLTMRRHQT